MSKRTFFLGLMLFSLFFGAGNLIFPPELGQLSGANFMPAMIGFIITAVGLPLLSIVGSALSPGGYSRDARRIHPLFSYLFFITICLALGPVVATPRTGTVAYEMGLLPFVRHSPHADLWMLLFLVAFFGAVLWLSLNPQKLVERIGQLLTPLLLLSLGLFIARAFFLLDEPIIPVLDHDYARGAFFAGFAQGYQTMDTISAIVFSFIILQAIKANGVHSQKAILKQCAAAACIAAVGIGVVYGLLGWIGNYYALSEQSLAAGNIGVHVLNGAAQLTYGEPGRLLLSLIVSLACLTTAIGLTVSISGYFHKIMPRIRYSAFVTIFTLISLGLASRGLDTIIRIAGPILDIIYPVTIVFIVLVYLDKILGTMPAIALRLPVLGTLLLSLFSVANTELQNLAIASTALDSLLRLFPFHDKHMEWLLPALLLWVIGLALGRLGPARHNRQATRP